MTANVPMMDMGSAREGMMVAETLRKNQKDHHDDQRNGQHEGELDVIDGFANGLRAVVENVQAHGGGICSRSSAAAP